MKRCFRCRVTKPTTAFNRSSKNLDGFHSYCRDCQSEHYRVNRVRHMANVRRSRDDRRAACRSLVADRLFTGCVDCGSTDIRVLQFDHVRGTKVDSVSSMIRIGRSVASVVAEMEKCEVRCANCHAIATLSRLGASWHDRFLNGTPPAP